MIKNLKLSSPSTLLTIILILSLLTIIAIGIPGLRKAQEEAIDGMSLPAIGAWNGFNDHMLVLECSNHSNKKANVELLLKDQENNIIGAEDLSIPPKGNLHTGLNKYPVNNAYGTLELNSSDKNAAISCRSITYRMNEDGVVQYATSSSLGEILSGTSYGVYNSMNPDGNIQNPVYNWLTIYNPGETDFSANIILRSHDGTVLPDKQIIVKDLPPGRRMDYGVGHAEGQVVGIYEIIPEDSTEEYGAFLSRYSEVSPGIFSFSMNIPSSTGMLDSGMVPASTMGPAINWAEIANISPETVSISLEVFNRSGELLFTTSKDLAPFSQLHEYLNAHIGELDVGFFRVQSTGNVLVQSLYYGQDVSNPSSIQWAYNTSGGFSDFAEATFPINTNLNAPNWLKVFGGSLSEPVSVELKIFSSDGSEVSIENEGKILVAGSLDVPLHQYTGPEFTGTLEIESEKSIQAQVVRVFTTESGNANTAMRSKSMKDISTTGSRSASSIKSMMTIESIKDSKYDKDKGEKVDDDHQYTILPFDDNSSTNQPVSTPSGSDIPSDTSASSVITPSYGDSPSDSPTSTYTLISTPTPNDTAPPVSPSLCGVGEAYCGTIRGEPACCPAGQECIPGGTLNTGWCRAIPTPTPAKKKCCTCYFGKADNCVGRGISDCFFAQGCVYLDGLCRNSFEALCTDWSRHEDQKDCDQITIFEEEDIYECDGEGVLGDLDSDLLPTGCTEMNIQRHGHSNEGHGPVEMNRTIHQCLDINPNCSHVNFSSIGCETFADPEFAEDRIQELIDNHPGVSFELTGNQNIGIKSNLTGKCLSTSYKTYSVSCDGDISISYESCSTVTNHHCESTNLGLPKKCTDRDGSIKDLRCCRILPSYVVGGPLLPFLWVYIWIENAEEGDSRCVRDDYTPTLGATPTSEPTPTSS